MRSTSGRHYLRAWTAAALAMAMSSPASAQYRIDSWTTEHGLPQSSVTGVLQTQDGFLWLTTFGGLVRFDGATLQVFNTVNTPGLRTSRFTGLFEARDGALWVITDGQGLTRYREKTFTSYTVANGLPHNRVHSVFYDAQGRLLIDTDKGMVQWHEGGFVPSRTVMPSRGEADRVILSRQDGGVVWYSDREGVHRFDNGQLARTLPLSFNPKRVYEDRSGRLWIETPDRRIAYFKDGRLITYASKDGIPPFATASIAEDREGNLWFGLRAGGGLLRFDGHQFTRYTTADGLPSDSVGIVYQDREGTLWAPTDGGLARLTPRAIAGYSAEHGLDADNTYPVFQDGRGDIWIGGWRGLTRYRDGAFARVAKQFGVAGENVMSIFEDRDGALWIGMWGGGVRRIKDGRVTSFPGRGEPPGTVVRAIYQGHGPDIWFGGQAGLSRYRDGVFTAITREHGFDGSEVYALYEDRAGTLWIGTETGLARYRDGRFAQFGETEGLTGYAVRAIHEDRDGTLWLGTYDSGLFRFRGGRFTRFTTREGLASNGAFQIIEDDRARFWISSNVGIYRLARSDLDDFAAGRIREVTSVPYGQRDGMLHQECNGGGQPAGIRSRDGRIWFPTQKGVAVFDPEKIPVNAQPPPVLITELLVANRPVSQRDRMEIRSGATAVEVQFAALTFVRPELSRFRYRMEGLEAHWVDAGQQRTARYAQLPYGNFRFRVIAANRDGAWNTQGASVQIVVVPPFWRTRWFLTLVIVSVVALAFAGHKRRLGVLRRQQEQREAFSRQLIDSQESERRRIASGLHDGLSQSLIVIKNWARLGQISLPEGHVARARLGDIEGAASQALSEVREVVHDLAPYQLDRLGLGDAITEMIDKVSDSSGIRFRRRMAAVDSRLTKNAAINLFRIIQEAVNNVVKHSGAREASVEMDLTGDILRVTIRDDGRGFEPHAAPDPKTGGRGFGLFGMSERMRMIGGSLAIDSSPGRGTSIQLEVPVGENRHG